MKTAVGFARGDITPPLGLPMGGYAARNGVAGDTLDALECRVAVFGDSTPLVCAVLDLLQLAKPWADDVRGRIAAELATRPERVLLAATHTHAGPAVFRPEASGHAALRAYEEHVAEVVVRTAAVARAARQPALLSAGATAVEDVGANRRDRLTPLDHRVRVLCARRPDDSVLGVVAVFGCHPTILPPENLAWSRDLFGAAVDAAEVRLGGTVLLFNGAAADVSTRFTRRAQTAAEVARLGGDLAERIAIACGEAAPLGAETLLAQRRAIAVHLRPSLGEADAALQAEEVAAELERVREGSDEQEMRLATSRLEGAMAQLWLARHGGVASLLGRVPTTAEVQCLAIGGVRLLAAPGEVFSEVSRGLGDDAFVIGYANDYLGYLVSPENGGDGEYEAAMAALAPQSAAAIEQALLEMAHE